MESFSLNLVVQVSDNHLLLMPIDHMFSLIHVVSGHLEERCLLHHQRVYHIAVSSPDQQWGVFTNAFIVSA